MATAWADMRHSKTYRERCIGGRTSRSRNLSVYPHAQSLRGVCTRVWGTCKSPPLSRPCMSSAVTARHGDRYCFERGFIALSQLRPRDFTAGHTRPRRCARHGLQDRFLVCLDSALRLGVQNHLRQVAVRLSLSPLVTASLMDRCERRRRTVHGRGSVLCMKARRYRSTADGASERHASETAASGHGD
jgi:hypothetical protein